MKKLFLFWVAIFIIAVQSMAQVGINTDGSQPDPSAGLDVKFLNKGLLPPRLTSSQRNTIVFPATGLLIFNTDCNDMQYYNGAGWVPLSNIGMLSSPSSITGSFTPCTNAIGISYTCATVSNATGYNWTVPEGAIITSGQGTQNITVNYGTTNGFLCVSGYNNCYRSNMTCRTITLTSSVSANVSIIASSNPVCSGLSVTYTATPVNGGTAPIYQWKVNGINVGSNSPIFSYVPVNGDNVICIMTSNAICVTGNPATSNLITMTVNSPPSTPMAGTHVASQLQITWNWNTVSGANGYKWNTTNNYSTATDMGTSTNFTETGLTCNTTYTRYVWAYNTCSGLPATLTQSTSACINNPCPNIPNVIYNGKTYNTVLIGAQCWLKENLNVGTKINGSQNQLNNGILEKYCYNDLESNCDIYGGLYQWDEAMQYVNTEGAQGICPTGWHIQTYGEWETLVTFVGGIGIGGGKIKESGISHWASPNTGATNNSGFTALPGGGRDNQASFYAITNDATFWLSSNNSTTQAWFWSVFYNAEDVYHTVQDKIIGWSIRCIHDAGSSTTTPTVMTNATSNITQTTATSGGNVTSDGGSTVTARGVCWSTSQNPTVSDFHTTEGSGTGTFNSNLMGLTASTVYYIRAYATNSVGTSYGNQVSFTTLSAMGQPCPNIPSVTYEGKIYNTILIGSQCWFKENLNVGIKINGTQTQTNNSIKEKYCYYDLESNCEIYGGLYQWNEMMQYITTDGAQGICPTGWHIPTDLDWCTLTIFIDPTVNCLASGYSGTDVGVKMKSTTLWSNNGNGTNESGFTALPGGKQSAFGSFTYLNFHCDFWSSTETTGGSYAWYRNLLFDYGDITRQYYSKPEGFSVRCLKD